MPASKLIRFSRQDGYSTDAKSGGITLTPGKFESSWHFSGDIGAGMSRRLKMRPGLDLWITDCVFGQNIIVSSDDFSQSLSFNFYLAGASMATVGSSQNTFEMRRGKQGICYVPEAGGINRVESGTRLRFVIIDVNLDRLSSYFDDDMHFFPKDIRKIVEKKRTDVFFQFESITPTMRTSLDQIVNCPYRGVTRKLFMESRALELIAYQLGQASASDTPGTAPAGLHPGDRQQTEFAKDLLVNDLEHPPHLKDLARAAGMSHPKLNRCFRRVYGMTVFQYLRHERLNQARAMLESQGLNVTETAFSVGYDSVSHFSQAYKKHFGISPGAYSRTI